MLHLHVWPSTAGKKLPLFVLEDTNLALSQWFTGLLYQEEIKKDMNPLAKPHIFFRGETSPAVTWCSLTNCSSYSRLSPLLPWLLGCLLPHFFTPADTREQSGNNLEQSKISLMTEEKQAKEKKNNREQMLSLTREAGLGELCSL